MAVAKHGVTTTTKDNILIDAGAVYIDFKDADSPGTLLGATSGGNTFELTRTLRDIRPDGAKGPVKGFRRLEEATAKITAKMLELTAENLRRAIAGAAYSSGTTLVEDEAVGTGDGETKVFALDYKPVVENSETVKVDGTTKTRLADYTIDYVNGEIEFFTAPALNKPIVATYKYISAAAEIKGADVASDSYVGNVAILGTLQGKSTPVICKITNALMDTGFSLSLAPNEEAIVELTFTGHYVAPDLTTEPWSVTYPAS